MKITIYLYRNSAFGFPKGSHLYYFIQFSQRASRVCQEDALTAPMIHLEREVNKGAVGKKNKDKTGSGAPKLGLFRDKYHFKSTN